MFRGRVVEVSEDIMFRWRLLVEEGRRSGRTFSQPDLIIAATALEHGLTLVTRNVRDFEGLGVDVLNPWVGRV
jgi:predicted nucleic acid-binding protein